MTGSKTPSAEPVRKAVVVTHGRPEVIGEALGRLEKVAREHDVEVMYPADEAEKHERASDGDPVRADIVVVLGGDGTMLRALQRTLGTGTPVIGVNFGDVGFLTSISADDLEHGLARVFAGDFVVVELPTLDAEVGGERHAAVNDVVVASSIVGRMVELGWGVGGEDLGVQPCDGVICSTPSGSTGTTSRTEDPSSSGGSTPRRSPSSLRIRCTRAHSSFREGGTSRSRTEPWTWPPRSSSTGVPLPSSEWATASSRGWASNGRSLHTCRNRPSSAATRRHSRRDQSLHAAVAGAALDLLICSFGQIGRVACFVGSASRTSC